MRFPIPILMLTLAAACGPDAESIRREEDARKEAVVAAEESKVPETLERIRQESRDRIHGRVTPPADTTAQEPAAAEPAATAEPEPVATPPATTTTGAETSRYPHSIQVGAYPTRADADRAAAVWTRRGFADVRVVERAAGTTAYPFAVRLFGYEGYAATRAEADRINRQWSAGGFPVEERP